MKLEAIDETIARNDQRQNSWCWKEKWKTSCLSGKASNHLQMCEFTTPNRERQDFIEQLKYKKSTEQIGTEHFSFKALIQKWFSYLFQNKIKSIDISFYK